MQTKNTYKCLSAAMFAAIAGTAHAADWSDTSVGVRWGNGFTEPGIAQRFDKTIFNFTHIDGDRLGTNMVVADVLKSSSADPAVNGGGGAQEIYGFYQRSLSLNALNGNKGGYGPFKDISLIGRLDMGAKDDAFGSHPRKVRVGVSASLPVSAGFWDIGLQAYKHYDHNGIVGKDVTFKLAPVLTSAWSIPIGSMASFDGFADIIGPKGKDGFGMDTKTEVMLDAKLMFNLGGPKSGFKAGIGYEYWKNKHGSDASIVPGAKQSTLMLLTEYHF